MKELEEKIKELRSKFSLVRNYLGVDKKAQRIDELAKKSEEVGFWDDSQKAARVMQELEELKKEAEMVKQIEADLSDADEFSGLMESEKDALELEEKVSELEKKINDLEFRTLLSEEYDRSDAILTIMSGAGGVDAQDWSEMLLRMYLRWAEKNNYKAKIVDESRGQEAGIKNATVEISGPFAYGYLKSEAGVHRLVRLSPFNSANLRQTSFSLVEVLPVVEEIKEVEINPSDLRVDVYRSQGAGGQSVNTTDSAVRITHLPTGTVVSCQNERSQLQNKEQAMKILRAKLHQKYLEEQEKEKRKLRGEQVSAEWGSQIRSYVIHPYKMVKDHRTKHETVDPEAVFSGELNDFMESYLRYIKK